MNFTTEQIAALTLLVGAFGTVATIIGGVVVKIISLKIDANTAMTREASAKTDAIALTTAKIDGHVNSEKTAGEGRENTLKRENELLREILAREKTAAQLLAQAAATTIPVVVAAPALVMPPPVPAEARSVLAQIETNTADTATNTARTDAKVDALKVEP